MDRIWTAKDDGRYISPMVATPGYRHTVGVARSWHFINVYGFVLTGVFFVIGLFTTEQWRRLVPTSPDIFVQAWNIFVYYANLHLPPEPNGFYGYNALQQLSYFATIFIMAPLSILTGMAMSPALVNRFPIYAQLFGGRQAARSIHFLLLIGFIGFTIVHVTLVGLTGFARNMNHIVLGIDDLRPAGMIVGFIGIAAVVLSWIGAHYVSWCFPRKLQHAQKAVTQPAKLITLDQLLPNQHYRKDQISPRLWPNGKMPERDDWKAARRRKLQGLQTKGCRSGGESCRAFSRRSSRARRRRVHHHASLHPGLDRHRAVGRAFDEKVDRTR